jgi:alanyl-tRNA synthetase
MEYELRGRHPRSAQNIDTGLGLERGSAILQDVMSVYETDGTADHGLTASESAWPTATRRRRRRRIASSPITGAA